MLPRAPEHRAGRLEHGDRLSELLTSLVSGQAPGQAAHQEAWLLLLECAILACKRVERVYAAVRAGLDEHAAVPAVLVAQEAHAVGPRAVC